MERETYIYKYEGPVYDKFGNKLADSIGNLHQNGTRAVSEAQARNNLAYRWKLAHGYDPKRMAVVLPGKFTIIY